MPLHPIISISLTGYIEDRLFLYHLKKWGKTKRR